MDGSLLSASTFDVTFNPDTRALEYDLAFTSEISDYIMAYLEVYAYGFQIISKEIDLCSIGWKQFCPLYPGSVEIDSIEYISATYVDEIPGIAYKVPDIDAIVRVRVLDYYNGTELACMQASFTNGKTVAHVGAKWATAVVAGIGLLSGSLLSAFGNSNAASHIAANAFSLFMYFQSVVIVSMEHVQEVPPIAAAWSENLAWSMGLIRITFMQDIFRWYVQATGGTPTLYLSSETIAILVQRSFNFVKKSLGFDGLDDSEFPNILSSTNKFSKRDDGLYSLNSNSNLLIFRGIKRIAYKAGIEITSVCCTGFTFFILCGYVLVGAFLIFKSSLAFLIKLGWIKPDTAIEFRKNWNQILKGVLQRYMYIGFTQLLILSLWQFIERDSPAVIVLACLFLLLIISVMGWACYRTLNFGSLSVKLHKNPAALLYGDSRILNRYGWFYTMFDAKKYWFGSVVLVHIVIKAIFIAFAQTSGKFQALAIFILDLFYTAYMIREMPYMDKPTNIINILINVVVTVNSFLFTFFSNLYGQPAPVAAIMGWVFFILNAAFSLILLLMIIVYACMAVFSKNPDARFAPAKDDRTSFQKRFNIFAHKDKKSADGEENETEGDLEMSKDVSNPEEFGELFALGQTARDHGENWAGQMYELKDYVGSDNKNSLDAKGSSMSPNGRMTTHEKDDFDSPVEVNQSLGSKIVHKLTGGKSLLRKRKQALAEAAASDGAPPLPAGTISNDAANTNDNEQVQVKRISDTLLSPAGPADLQNPASAVHNRTESATPILVQGSKMPEATSASTADAYHNIENVGGQDIYNENDFSFNNLTPSRKGSNFYEGPSTSLNNSIDGESSKSSTT
ncbi:hypothetical protein PACTADRAFT_48631 [Pachysolen tannophilus NRRL Y-2460]|uniref:ML-like domain-containing protein n=1 Tax=Pachysolen tannophilus NRRL Y-2460 TaxID=669874 RepID=A0A1E4TYL3_PACTA|nr:hypothetical protein PACTADRAFT_48631 [Pachysolen tannophilus NRRL Y-2460]